MKIKNGKVFYRLVIEKNATTKQEFMEFIRTKTTDMASINDIDGINFDQSQATAVNLPDVRIELHIKHDEILMLFHTTMSTSEFDEYTKKWFV